jgi:ABC-type nitrate/sulfonate/bicarbonate transport system permease component
LKLWLGRGATLAASIAIGCSLWWLGSVIANSESFPGPLDVILTSVRIVFSPVFALSFVETIWMALVGLLLGLVVSYAAALLMSVSSFLETSLWPTLNFLRSIPTIVLLPLFLVLFGIGINAVIIITAFGTFSKLVIFAVDGIRSKRKELEDVSELSGFGWLQKFLVVQLPMSAQFILSGLQLSMSRAYGLVVLSGLLIGAPGLGKDLRQATNNARYEEIFAYGLILAILGVLLYLFVLRFESKLLRRWGVVN